MDLRTPLEMVAARAMLDEIHGQPQEQDSSDLNNYCLGRIQRHNVVIACLPDYGTTTAAVVAEQMLHTFKEIRFSLMVGIGGGVPSVKNNIRLGDVVVSRPKDTLGGVVQYDFGKAVKDGHFERTGSLDWPPQTLLYALRTLEATPRPRGCSHPSLKDRNQRSSLRIIHPFQTCSKWPSQLPTIPSAFPTCHPGSIRFQNLECRF